MWWEFRVQKTCPQKPSLGTAEVNSALNIHGPQVGPYKL